MSTDLRPLLITADQTIREAMTCIDRTGKGIVLVVNADRRLLATVTDGDIRRAILAGLGMEESMQELLARRPPSPHPSPVTAPVGTSPAELRRLMDRYTLRHIPLVDDAGRVVDLALLSDLVKEPALPLQAVVMAGGYGTRLRPLTEGFPKPMLPVGGRPLLEHIINQLKQAGIRRVNLTTHYRGDVITRHFGDGREFGIEIQYVQEDEPLGTAGALHRLEGAEGPLLVINGDILTRLDFRAIVEFHNEQRADMTVAVRLYEMRVPYGVVETEGVAVTRIVEKPVAKHFINAGIYLLNPDVRRLIPQDRPYDMPELIGDLLARGGRVVSFPIAEYWVDIGQADDYHKALDDAGRGEV